MRYILILFSSCCLSLLLSCNLQEVNVNPNDPTEVPMETLLPPAERALANALTGDAAVLSGIFVNYFEGIENRFLPAELYVIDRDFLMRPIWSDYYLNALTSLQLIIRQAVEQEAPHYEGVARILMSLGMSTVTDLWGDVPYSNAFNGPENLTPLYDGQAEVYQRLEQELTKAIAALEAEESVFSPAADDVFFAGDRAAWIRLANSLLARIQMHQINRETIGMNQILDRLDMGLQAREDGLVYPYNEQEPNPWYQFQTTTPYVQIDDAFEDLLDDDPRREDMIKVTFGENQIGPYYASQLSPVYLVSWEESLFLRAEALLRDGQTQAAETALREAVSEHIDRVTEGEADPQDVDNYLTARTNLSGNFESDLEIIMEQKYIASFTGIESWTDYRRTGYPILTPNPGGENPDNPGGDIPRRFLYPLNEILYNPNIPTPQPNLQQPVWWDING